MTDAQHKKMMMMFHDGFTGTEIAKAIGISQGHLTRTLAKDGLSINARNAKRKPLLSGYERQKLNIRVGSFTDVSQTSREAIYDAIVNAKHDEDRTIWGTVDRMIREGQINNGPTEPVHRDES